jgi:hypothetical protein
MPTTSKGKDAKKPMPANGNRSVEATKKKSTMKNSDTVKKSNKK